MRILRVAQKSYPEVNGGGAYHVHAMSRDQAAMGHDVTVLTVRRETETPHLEERDGYTVVRYDPTVSPLGNDLSAGASQYLHDARGFDVVHAHSHLYFSTNLAALKRRFGETPLAITNHGLYSQTAPERIFEWYLKTVGRWTFDQADVAFCYTDVCKRQLREFDVQAPIEVVPNGIDTERFRPEGPESDLLESSGPIVLFVGRLVEGKRPQDALAAVERVREAYPDVTLYFCGEGPLRDRLEERAGDRLGDGVEFLGHLPYEEMPRVYRSADVLVLPSRTEGVPRTVLEAMASDVRVVCSDLEQVAAVIGKAGSVAPVGDVKAFADEIETQLSRSSPRSDGGLGSTYDWRSTVEQTTSVLREISRR
ncbi:glycosyltransferase family 4 protein [Natronococcus sp. A-GB7]|uniref:glycosyltransferase family 4 protein n=1 Tax=Natronococcus sp. A-GB7 TaxID=3037649 RepID=UPI00241E2BC6|nr:glycosyltransferase family 4 protein [Natronococcus sp. A-GB7]MDG5818592.1 glycosyltransferase family 4 protein [Natronococcus sp. A-GB7]